MGRSVRRFISGEEGERKSILLLQDSQAVPARPSVNDTVKVKTLGC
jgi:hypothetical protein